MKQQAQADGHKEGRHAQAGQSNSKLGLHHQRKHERQKHTQLEAREALAGLLAPVASWAIDHVGEMPGGIAREHHAVDLNMSQECIKAA